MGYPLLLNPPGAKRKVKTNAPGSEATKERAALRKKNKSLLSTINALKREQNKLGKDNSALIASLKGKKRDVQARKKTLNKEAKSAKLAKKAAKVLKNPPESFAMKSLNFGGGFALAGGITLVVENAYIRKKMFDHVAKKLAAGTPDQNPARVYYGGQALGNAIVGSLATGLSYFVAKNMSEKNENISPKAVLWGGVVGTSLNVIYQLYAWKVSKDKKETALSMLDREFVDFNKKKPGYFSTTQAEMLRAAAVAGTGTQDSIRVNRPMSDAIKVNRPMADSIKVDRPNQQMRDAIKVRREQLSDNGSEKTPFIIDENGNHYIWTQERGYVLLPQPQPVTGLMQDDYGKTFMNQDGQWVEVEQVEVEQSS